MSDKAKAELDEERDTAAYWMAECEGQAKRANAEYARAIDDASHVISLLIHGETDEQAILSRALFAVLALAADECTCEASQANCGEHGTDEARVRPRE